MADRSCYHCGERCGRGGTNVDGRDFCRSGCRTVYEVFTSHGLSHMYGLDARAASATLEVERKDDFLDNADLVERLLEFDGEGIQIIGLSIPSIHCSSCIWVLDNLNRLHPSIKSSQVDFPKKTLRVTY